MTSIVAGIFVRMLYFGSIPAGLNQDEASVGYDAWSLAHFGTDGNGVRWPVHLVSWGSGGNASYAYMALPFVAHALTPFFLRLPMLISAIASIMLVGFIVGRLFGEKAGWGAAVAVALSPWHIMLSRWGLDCNALLFLFLCGLALLVVAAEANGKLKWQLPACIMLGISVYSYGAAYLSVPLFVLAALALCVMAGLFSFRNAFLGASVFALTMAPIALYVLVNSLRWNAISLGGITVPRLPVVPRFETQLAGGAAASHVWEFVRLLATQEDGTVYNVTAPYGVMYSSLCFVLALGILLAIPYWVIRRRWPPARLFISLWFLACIPAGVVQEPNINRINLLLMALVVATGLALAVVDNRVRGALVLGILTLLVPFSFFTRDYFTTQRQLIAVDFFDGLIPALDYAKRSTRRDAEICVTGQVNMPYIYVLFSDPRDPQEHLKTVRYVDPTSPFREVTSFGRYTFGLERCDFSQAREIVSHHDEAVAAPFVKSRSFGMFDVYSIP
jgi:hypothetical protein